MSTINGPTEYDGTRVANGAYGEGLAVIAAASDTFTLAATAGQDAYGLTTETTVAGRASRLAVGGFARARCGGVVAANGPLRVQATTGRLEASAANTDNIFARALEAGVDGDFIAVRIEKKGSVA